MSNIKDIRTSFIWVLNMIITKMKKNIRKPNLKKLFLIHPFRFSLLVIPNREKTLFPLNNIDAKKWWTVCFKIIKSPEDITLLLGVSCFQEVQKGFID